MNAEQKLVHTIALWGLAKQDSAKQIEATERGRLAQAPKEAVESLVQVLSAPIPLEGEVKMSTQPPTLRRRTASKLLLALPAAAWLPATPGETQEPEKPSPTAEFIASQQAELSLEERERLTKNIGRLEKALAAIRDFKLPFEVSPCLRFEPRRSRGR